MSTVEEVATPTELQFVEVSANQIVLTWSGPLGAVSEYRINVAPVDEPGKPQRELTVPAIQSAYVVKELHPGTVYRFNIYALFNGRESAPLVREQATSGSANTQTHIQYIHTYIHTHIHLYTHTYIHTYTHTDTHTPCDL